MEVNWVMWQYRNTRTNDPKCMGQWKCPYCNTLALPRYEVHIRFYRRNLPSSIGWPNTFECAMEDQDQSKGILICAKCGQRVKLGKYVVSYDPHRKICFLEEVIGHDNKIVTP